MGLRLVTDQLVALLDQATTPAAHDLLLGLLHAALMHIQIAGEIKTASRNGPNQSTYFKVGQCEPLIASGRSYLEAFCLRQSSVSIPAKPQSSASIS
jgi:hypothetical protein